MINARALYELLPAVHRTRDAQSGGALWDLIQAAAEQIALLEEDLMQLYDDQFIETCADWVVPYIGDLIGYNQLRGATARVSSPRAEVADTIRLRRGKGTAAALEMLARDVTGWDVHVAEMFRHLAMTQHMNRVRVTPMLPDLRHPEPLERIGGAFDPVAHTASTRFSGASGRGGFGIGELTIFMWRLQAYPVTSAPASKVDAQRYLFSPFGIPTQLFVKPAAATTPPPARVAGPLTRMAAAAAPGQYYGADQSLFVQGVTPDAVSFCNLSDAGSGAWAHAPSAGHVSIDPVLGRIAFGTAPAAAPLVTWHRGFAADLGGGGYDRLASFQSLQPVIAVPSAQPTVQAGVNTAAQGGAVQIADSGRYAETIAINPTAAGAFVELRAADQVAPFLALGGDLLISGADGTDVCLNGLWIAGGRVRVPASAANTLRRLTLRHCTLTPGIARNTDGSAAQPDAPSLVIETAVEVVIENCILGGVRAAPGASVSISDSIVDAGRPDGVVYAALDGAAAGAPLSASRVTMIGKARATQFVLASDAIFVASLSPGDTWAAPVLADRRSVGCARFSYFPPGARTPRRYECQPAAGADPIVTQPVFASLRFGDPGYCQLSARTPREIRNGAEDGGEMGAFQSLAQAQRETNLRARLGEHLRFGIEASLAYVT